ncbi:type II toxin-antitoxin system RelE/ParE family toxin [Ohtaekwangia sp.]|uniref:type II toxin-antitoxin system RelE/ParE family toxin n=1 Tax=Ohtaekwangia sp. TaxID=2066019 RepID=UPI002FDCF8C0
MTLSKSFEILMFPTFERELSKIISSYPQFRQDISQLKESLKKNPEQGKHLGGGIYKIRIEISGKPAGKRYGARVIIAVFTSDREVLLLKIYDKSDTKDLTPSELTAIRKMVGEIRKQRKKR